MSSDPAVVGLDDPTAGAPSLTGGKGANLAALVAAGIPVPDGFCVATGGYREAAAAAGLADLLARPTTSPQTGPPPDPLTDPLTDAAPDAAPDLAASARAALLATPIPAGTAAAVRGAYARLGTDVPVAVRSSATAEDLPSASFAGQQDTYLNVVGPEAVLDAVRRCWASLWTDRAVRYRAEAGIDHREVALAVVVQRMLDVDVAGVLFTADPLSGRRTRCVIDAAPGLGEAVVSGAVNPDHVVVEDDAAGGRPTIVRYQEGDKAVAVRPRPGGGTETVRAPRGPAGRALSDAQVAALVALGRRVAAGFGTPQDIEWAIDRAGALWITQSRPITTLYPLPRRRAAGTRAFFCFTLAQGLVRPITPMGRSVFGIIAAAAAREIFGASPADPLAGPDAVQDIGGRTFVDVTAALRNPVGRVALPRLLDVMEARTAVVLRELCRDPAFAVAGSRVRFARGALRAALRFRAPGVALLAVVSPAAAGGYLRRLQAPVRRLAPLPAGAPPERRLAAVLREVGRVFPAVPRYFPVWAPGLALLHAARAVAGGAMDATAADDVLRSLPHNVTSEMDLELWALAGRVRADAAAAAALADAPPAELAGRYRAGTLPWPLQHGLAAFLDRYGHRAVAEIDVGLPRWSDDPHHVLGVLANYLRVGDPALAPDAQFARGVRVAEATVDRIVADVRRRSRPRAGLVRLLLNRARRLIGWRESHKDHLVRVLAYARRELGAVGTELAARGLLTAADDVWFLDLRELRAALAGRPDDLRALVGTRRAEYDRELRRRHVPRILLSDGTEPEALAPGPTGGTGDLVGTPASAGTGTGPARIVLDPVGAHLEPGEILVAPSTDPGWTPLFLTAGGLVMEMGGPNSHGAVVAREYGIPAVVGVAGATSRLRDGDVVTVDGAAGLVHTGTPIDSR